MALQLKRIDHVAFITPDIEKALPLWRDVLGMRLVKEGVIEDQGIRGVLLDAGDGEIEIIQPIRGDTGVARFLEQRGEDLHHVAFETDDVAAELQRARELGIEVIDDEPRQGLSGLVGFLHPKSNYGVLVELVQKTAASPPLQSDGPEQPFSITGIDHVGIAARDIHGCSNHFVDKYDMPVFKEWGPEKETGLESVSVEIGAGWLEIVTSHNPEDESVYVERALRKQGDGMVMMALKVRDFAAAMQAIPEQGVTLTEVLYLDHKMAMDRPLMHVPRREANGVRLQLIAEAPVQV